MDKMDTWFNLFWGLLGIGVGFLLSEVVANIELMDMRKTAIEKGVAEYNSTTGKWQWKDELEQE
jgi:hypothetical protein